jgi:hypothetical protein
MSTWVIVSWVFVAILTTINIVVFLKLKGASEQMLKMAFPNAKNMNEALSQMQGMMGGMGGMPGGRASPFGAGAARPTASRGVAKAFGQKSVAGPAAPAAQDAQLKAAMDMLKNIQKKK